MDKILHGTNLTPDAASYDVVHHLHHHLQTQAKENSKKAKMRQLRNYNKNRRELTFKSKDRVWQCSKLYGNVHFLTERVE